MPRYWISSIVSSNGCVSAVPDPGSLVPQEIVAMWRFTKNNGLTEGFYNIMELINRQAYGFRNFQTTDFA